MTLTIDRRLFLSTAGVAGAAAMLPPMLPAIARAEPSASLAENAFIWGLPLLLTGRYLNLARDAGVPLNQFSLSPDLATPQTRAVGPNVDTLYGYAWLDLASEPQVIAVPDTHDRYYSIQLIDAYQNSFTYIGRRTTGTKAGAFVLTAPGYRGPIPAGVTEIKAPTSTVLAFVRTLVRSPADLPAARAVHFSYRLGGVSAYPDRLGAPVARTNSINVFPRIDLSNVGDGWVGELDALVRRYPPLPFDAPALARFAPLGIGTGGRGAVAQSSVSAAAAAQAALARIQGAFSADTWEANGWRTKLGVVPFIHDPLTRAATALYGPGTHIAAEALYFGVRRGPDGKPLSGAQSYRLNFAPGQTPPVDAFWSLILYDKDFFLYDNVLNKYAITDRTQGLRYRSDGSLDIVIQHADPQDLEVNWLPAPSDVFSLTMRTYQPRKAILDKTYRLPPLEAKPIA